MAILKPSPSRPNRLSARIADVLERERGRVRRALAHLVQVRLDRHARRVHRDDERGHTLVAALRVGLREDDRPRGVAGIRDEGLRAVEDVLVALAHGGGRERRDVGARARLGETERREDRLLDQRRQPLRLLLVAAECDHGPEPRPFAVMEVPIPEQPQYSSSPTSIPSKVERPRPAVLLGDVQVHQPDLVRLRDHVHRVVHLLVVLVLLRAGSPSPRTRVRARGGPSARRSARRNPCRGAVLDRRHRIMSSAFD